MASFGSLPFYSYENQPSVETDGQPLEGIVEVPRTSRVLTFGKLPSQAFMGIAVSGGGSRSANFAAAAFKHLNDLGFLQHASMISCVSGGCLPTAYYGLHGEHTDWDEFPKLMGTNFFRRWLWKLAYPHNLVRNFLTDWDRSDAMASVFDDALFQGATFKDLGDAGPKIMINATMIGGLPFTFASGSFRELGSRLDTYPIANAVMASGAFPAAFNNVTLANFRNFGNPGSPTSPEVDHYVHLFDGGSSDNLGVKRLLEILDNAVDSADHFNAAQPKGCLLILVDAYPGKDDRWNPRALAQSDPRSGIDFLIDRNVVDATDTMLQNLRDNLIVTLRNDSGYTVAYSPYWRYRMEVKIPDKPNIPLDCNVWHLTFERLESLAWNPPENQNRGNFYRMIRDLTSGVETHYKLTGLNCESYELQNALYDTAHILVRDDHDTLEQVCEWFEDMNLSTTGCHSFPPKLEPRPLPVHYIDIEKRQLVCD